LSELVFCKLGGSVITDKLRPSTPRGDVIARLAAEVASARAQRPGMRVLLGHGSGSFGHVVARRYEVREGIAPGGDWWGYAKTGAAAGQLNRLVTDAFIGAGVPVVSMQPSASAQCRSGALTWMAEDPIHQALERGLVPLIYGDVAFDDQQGCTIVSTEAEFAYLAARLRPARIILVGEVDGVYDADPLVEPAAVRVARITPATHAAVEAKLSGSHGVDVTGGMLSKVREMVQLVERGHVERVHLISGSRPGALREVLLDPGAPYGTVIVGAEERHGAAAGPAPTQM
jgi:isopentenyl phosphate kinase